MVENDKEEILQVMRCLNHGDSVNIINFINILFNNSISDNPYYDRIYIPLREKLRLQESNIVVLGEHDFWMELVIQKKHSCVFHIKLFSNYVLITTKISVGSDPYVENTFTKELSIKFGINMFQYDKDCIYRGFIESLKTLVTTDIFLKDE